MDLFGHDVMVGGVLLGGEERKKTETESIFGWISRRDVVLKKMVSVP